MEDFNFSIDEDLFLEFLQEESNGLKLSKSTIKFYKEFCKLIPETIKMTNIGSNYLIVSDPVRYNTEIRFGKNLISIYKVGTDFLIDYWSWREDTLSHNNFSEICQKYVGNAIKIFKQSAL